MPTERTDYDDGGWCERQFVDGKLHGRWTVFYASGLKRWEREYDRGRQEGYEREWDQQGHLREEKSYHFGVLHGLWREWGANGVESVVGDFRFGSEKDFYEKWPPLVHSHWERIFPFWMWEPHQFRSQIQEIERVLALPTRRLTRDASRSFRDEFGASYFNYVNVLGSGEEWPNADGNPFVPLLQLDCRNLGPLPSALSEATFLTMFARSNPTVASRDLVIRTYRRGEVLRQSTPPPEVKVEDPRHIQFGPPEASYPDGNDLPPGLRAALEDELPDSPILKESRHRFSTRLGGWPSWLQESGVYSYGEFVLQIDALDVPALQGGDSAVHYFFCDKSEWTWVSESLSPLFHPSGPH